MAGNQEENIDQLALRKWIQAGLSIPEILDLKGDAGYLLNNMIAKYTLSADRYEISEGALREFEKLNVDLSKVYRRAFFYGKKIGGRENPFIYEHAIPATVIREQLIEAVRYEKIKGTESIGPIIERTLSRSGVVAVLLRYEDKRITDAKLGRKMPENWSFGDDPLARYKSVGINLSGKVLKVEGAIYR